MERDRDVGLVLYGSLLLVQVSDREKQYPPDLKSSQGAVHIKRGSQWMPAGGAGKKSSRRRRRWSVEINWLILADGDETAAEVLQYKLSPPIKRESLGYKRDMLEELLKPQSQKKQ